MPQDWFSDNAPKQSSNGGDWFSSNAPSQKAPAIQNATVSEPGLLDQLANAPNNIPLDSYKNATLHGIASIGQGAAQALQGGVQMVSHPIDTLANIGDVATLGLTHLMKGSENAKGGELLSSTANLPSQAAALVKNPPTLGEVGDVAGQTGGQIIAGMAGEKALSAGVKLPFRAYNMVKTAKTLADVPAALSQEATSTLATVAHNEGLPPIASTEVRQASEELQQAFFKRAKDQYAIVDKAVDGNLKPVLERIEHLQDAYDAQKNVNPDLAAEYFKELGEQHKNLGQLIEQAKAKGVPDAEQIMKAGDRDYSRFIAMKKKIVPAIKRASGEARYNGVPNPQVFATQIDVLNNSGILSRTLGPDAAKALIETAKEGVKKAKTASTVSKIATRAASGAAYTAGGAAVGIPVAYGIKHILSGDK